MWARCLSLLVLGCLLATAAPAAAQDPGGTVEELFGPWAGVGLDPLGDFDADPVEEVQPPDYWRQPYFHQLFGADLMTAPAERTAASVTFGPGPDGQERVYVAGTDDRIRAFDAKDPTIAKGTFGSLADAGGIAYHRGEVFVVERSTADPELARIEVFDSAGAHKRTLPLVNPLGVADMTGIDAMGGELWVTGEICGGFAGIVEILDATTGALKGVAGTVAHTPTGDTNHLCEEDYDASRWWDIAVLPEYRAAVAQYRLLHRGVLAALTTIDPELGCPRCFRRLWQEGTESVPGMRWMLAVDGYGRTTRGTGVTEFSVDAQAPTGMPYLVERRRWEPQQAASGGVRDIAYRNRETRIDWKGDLTQTDWQRGNRCLSYVVSDADFYAIGRRGEHWYELARGFQKIEMLVDGQVTPFVQGGVTMTQSANPVGQMCWDSNTKPSGQHDITLRAVVRNGAKTVETSNPELRIDHDVPTGRVDPLPRWVSGSVTVTGTMADAHAGPRDRQLKVAPANQGWRNLCGLHTAEVAGPTYSCTWNTTAFPDGRSDLAAHMRDRVTTALGGPNESDTPVTSTVVDNTAPGLGLSGELWNKRDKRPAEYGQPQPLRVDAPDAGSGTTRVEVAVDGQSKAVSEGGCGGGGCTRTLDWTLRPDDFLDGEHTVTVTARDQLGNLRTESWVIDVEAPPAPDAGEEEAALGDNESGAPNPTATRAGFDLVAGDLVPDPPGDLDRTVLPCTQPDTPANFSVYSLGQVFESLRVSAVLRRCDVPFPGEAIRANFVSYIYGDCDANPVSDNDDEGCVPPLEVQTWPACERALADYSFGPGQGLVDHDRLTLRGVPAARFEGGLRLEVYTGDATVVIFGDQADQVSRAADAIRQESPTHPANALPSFLLATASPILPPPARDAVQGLLPCLS